MTHVKRDDMSPRARLRGDGHEGHGDDPASHDPEILGRAFAAAPAALAVLRLSDGMVLEANDEALALVGSTSGSMIGRTLLDTGLWANLDDREALRHVLQKDGSLRNGRTHLRTAAGDLQAVRISAEVIDADNGPLVIVSLVDDTEQERLLDESDARFRAAFMNGALGTVIVGRDDGLITDANDRFLEMYGYAREECIGRTSVDLGMWADPGERESLLGALERQGRVDDFHVSAVRKDGRAFDVLYSVRTLEVRGQRPLLVGAIRDVTEEGRTRADLERSTEALRASEARLQTLVDDAVVAIGISQQGRTSWVNEAYLHLFGFESAAEILDRPLVEQIAPEDRETVTARALRRARGEDVEPTFEATCLRRDGSMFPAHFAVSRLVLPEGPVSVAFITDLSELKQAQAELRQAQKLEAVGQLAGGIAHDFNNALAVIMMGCSAAAETLDPGSDARENLDDALGAAERARNLTRQLLAFSRRRPIAMTDVDLGSVVIGMERMICSLVGDAIQTVFVATPDEGTVHADENELEQVLMNLAVNARDAMPSGGRLVIETSRVTLDRRTGRWPAAAPGEYVLLSVSDTGVGIGPETLERIFEPFFTTKEPGRGTGLGLSTVFGIVRRCGGHIGVDSTVGKGTTFRVLLPRVEAATRGTEGPVSSEPGTLGGDEKILVVDDDDHVRGVIRSALQRHGYSVLDARNAGEALLVSQHETGTIHLLVTDLAMPHVSGLELADRLRADRRDLKVIVCSGHGIDDVIAPLPGPEATLLAKPFTTEELLRSVRAALASAEPASMEERRRRARRDSAPTAGAP